jgi:hypothetical protein
MTSLTESTNDIFDVSSESRGNLCSSLIVAAETVVVFKSTLVLCTHTKNIFIYNIKVMYVMCKLNKRFIFLLLIEQFLSRQSDKSNANNYM